MIIRGDFLQCIFPLFTRGEYRYFLTGKARSCSAAFAVFLAGKLVVQLF